MKALPNVKLVLCEPFGLPVSPKKDIWPTYHPKLSFEKRSPVRAPMGQTETTDIGTLRPATRLINTAGFSPVYQRPHANQPFQRLPNACPNLLRFDFAKDRPQAPLHTFRAQKKQRQLAVA
ncbi:MAG TPA: hypothetical protein VEC99_09750 [Clostridia bacterium]|nr:hypothetical protein [Clostridia bacterium]